MNVTLLSHTSSYPFIQIKKIVFFLCEMVFKWKEKTEAKINVASQYLLSEIK